MQPYLLPTVACFAVLCACSISPCAAIAADRQPNILLLVADDLRADVTSVYGGPVNTPNLEKLANRGALFRRATCGFPICHVSRAEMLTGRILVAEAAKARGLIPLDSWKLWPHAMRDAGWRTIHYGKWHVAGTPASCGYTDAIAMYSGDGAAGQPLTFPKSATGRIVTGYPGWTFKDADNQPLLEYGIGLTPHTDDRIATAAAATIREGSERPLFVHVNFTAPHDPLHWPEGRENSYRADDVKLPQNFRESHPFDHGNLTGRDEVIVPAPRSADDVRRERAVYYAVVENLDAQIGRILAAINESADSQNWIVIFTSDQGLALGSHGLMGKQNQYEHTINTPLIMSGPGIPRGKTLDAQCTLRDLYPTICELAGVEIPSSVQGESFVTLLQGETEMTDEPIYGYFTDTQRMIRTADGWKVIWYPQLDRMLLFDVQNDPDELRNLGDDPQHVERRQELFQRLQMWLKEHGDTSFK